MIGSFFRCEGLLASLVVVASLASTGEALAQPVSAAAISPHPEGFVRVVARPVREGRTEIRWQRFDARGERVGNDRLLRRTSGRVGVLRAARMPDGRTAIGWASRTEWHTNVYAVVFTDDRGRRPRRPVSLGVFRAPADPADIVLIPQGDELIVLHFGQTASCQEDGGEGSDCPELVVSTIDAEGALESVRGVGWPNGSRVGPALPTASGRAYLTAEVTVAGANAIREAGAPERCALPGCHLGVAPVEGAEFAFADGVLVLVARTPRGRHVGAWSGGEARLPMEEMPESGGDRLLPRLGSVEARCSEGGLGLHLSVGDAEVLLPAGEGATIPWHAFLDILEGASDSLWTGSALVTLKSNGRTAAFVCESGRLIPRPR